MKTKLFAFRGPMPSTPRVALGPLGFALEQNLVLRPQPTQQQIDTYKLGDYVTQIEVEVDGEPTAAPAPIAAPAAPSYGKISVAPTLPNVLDQLLDEDEEEDAAVMVAAPAPANAPAGKVNLKTLTLLELRAICDKRGVVYAPSATKAKLLELLTEG